MFKHFDICVTILLIDIFNVCWMYISYSPSHVHHVSMRLSYSVLLRVWISASNLSFCLFVCLFVEWSSWFLCLIRSETELCWYGLFCRISVTQNWLTEGICITLQLLSLCGNESCLENWLILLVRWLSMKICIFLPHMDWMMLHWKLCCILVSCLIIGLLCRKQSVGIIEC